MRPALLLWPPGEPGDARMQVRAFTECVDDLDVDFSMAPRHALVSELLALCVEPPTETAHDGDFVWRWTTAERLQALLAIARASQGPMTQAVAHCGHADCGGQVEMELGLEGFALHTADAVDWTAPDGQSLRLRLPRGGDLVEWSRQLDQDPKQAEHWLARRLIERADGTPMPSGWVLPPTWLAPIALALNEADPLTALSLTVVCPFCGREVAVDVDLEMLLVESLRSRQRRLTDEIHQLAVHYHWSEAQIVALPPWRRRRYLSRLQADLA